MVRRCSVGDCGNTARDGVSLHGFPPILTSTSTLRKLWISRVKTTRRDWKTPARTSLVCSAHFREDDFDPSERLKVSMGLTPPVRFLRRLLPAAVPSLFMRHVALATWTPKATAIMIGEARRKRQRKYRVRLFRHQVAAPSGAVNTANAVNSKSNTQSFTRWHHTTVLCQLKPYFREKSHSTTVSG